MNKINAEIINIIDEIKNIPEELRVQPLHYYRCNMALSIPEVLRTVKELKDEIDIHPENILLLNEILRDVKLISAKMNIELLKGKTIEELYDEVYSSTEMASANIFAQIYKEALLKKMSN